MIVLSILTERQNMIEKLVCTLCKDQVNSTHSRQGTKRLNQLYQTDPKETKPLNLTRFPTY